MEKPKSNKNIPVHFYPLDAEERSEAAKKLHVRVRMEEQNVQNRGIGEVFRTDPVVSIQAKPDGACLFNTLSLLVTGRDLYSFMFRHAICSFIADPKNDTVMKQHIPVEYQNGSEYIRKTGRREPFSWGTDTEIYACAIMTGFDILVYSQQRKWLIYSKIGKGQRTSKNALYVNNVSGNHFDPVYSAIEY